MDNGFPEVFTPMLATLVPNAFDSPNHVFEVKWDGVRTLAFCNGSHTKLFARSKREVTHQYAEFADTHKKLKVRNAILDGEIVALDDAGRPSFGLLQNRINLSRPSDIRRAMERIQLDFVVFDVVFVDGEWIGGMPLESRLEKLEASVSFEERVLRSQVIPEHGVALFEAAAAKGLEGIVAKKLGSTYMVGRRSRDWSKIKVTKSADCVIGGFSAGGGRRSSVLGALLVGAYDDSGLRYVGSVGTGFNDRLLTSLTKDLKQIANAESPFVDKIPSKGVTWVEPRLVCEVEFREFTMYSKMRAPSFKGLRTDKSPLECRLEDQFGV